MAIFVVNAGSSSVKFRLYQHSAEAAHLKSAHRENVVGKCLAEGLVERIGAIDAQFHYKSYVPSGALGFNTANTTLNNKPFEISETPVHEVSNALDIPDHEAALNAVLRAILNSENGVLKTRADVSIVGHRIVHGGDKFVSPTLITREVKSEIEKCVRFAPLHNPVNLAGLAACERLFPAAYQVAVFDTAFHSTIAEHVFLYPLPYILYERHRIRRYGFHGTSHKYVSQRATALLKEQSLPFQKIVVCHLGNGASVCAIENGKSIDTSMGFTPLEGLMMGTRVGDVDPGVLIALLGLEGMSAQELDRIVNKYSGFKGVTEDTSDVRTVLEKAESGYPRHQVALDMYCYRVRKYIGAYAAAMNGIDVLIFTGGVGENANAVRQKICADLTFLGVDFSPEANAVKSRDERFLTHTGSRVSVLVVPTNEEWMIAQDSLEVIQKELDSNADFESATTSNFQVKMSPSVRLSSDERLTLVRTWNELGGDPAETLKAFADRCGKQLSLVQLSKELAALGIRY